MAPRPRLALPRNLLIAHRGVPARYPENSFAGLVAARDAGAAVVELDVRITSDDLLVVLHDASPKRMTGQDGPASGMPAARLVAQALLNDPAQRLLLLDEALALLVGRAVVDVEVKPSGTIGADRLAHALLAALERAGSPDGIVVTSEDERVIAEVRARAPRLRTGLVFRSRDARDPVALARNAAASLIVASRTRVEAGWVGDARSADLAVWAYTVNDAAEARALFAAGCAGCVTDDLPRLRQELGATVEPADERPSAEPAPILVIDLGSSTTKALLVDPRHGCTSRVSAPTPVRRPAAGRVEHDAVAQLGTVLGLLDRLAERQPLPPRVAAIASQRSTGLWADPRSLAPLTPAVSWQDRRAEPIVERLADSRPSLEAIAGLPLAPAWTAPLGRALASEGDLPPDRLLIPLGSWVTAKLTGEAPAVDPTLANRMFLVDGASGDWSTTLLDAFALTRRELPRLTATVARHGSLTWPSGNPIPLSVLVGDQQAAYVGAAGPLGHRVVVNVGTGGFVMRGASPREATPGGARRAPLWTSASHPSAPIFLIELPVLFDGPRGNEPLSADEWVTLLARQIALGETEPASFASRCADAIGRLAGQRHGSVLLAGGALVSPQLVALIGRQAPIPVQNAREVELTALGAARLAAAHTGLAWSIPGGGGLGPSAPSRV